MGGRRLFRRKEGTTEGKSHNKQAVRRRNKRRKNGVTAGVRG